MQFSESEAFDENISVDISLSKILDAFIFENESPKTIIAFLEQHDSSFKEIISHSICWTRLFQIDFVLQCEDEQVDYLISKLKSIPGKIAAYCSWQICCSNSFTSQKLKFLSLFSDFLRYLGFSIISRLDIHIITLPEKTLAE